MALWLTSLDTLRKAATVPLADVVEPTADAALLRLGRQQILAPNPAQLLLLAEHQPVSASLRHGGLFESNAWSRRVLEAEEPGGPSTSFGPVRKKKFMIIDRRGGRTRTDANKPEQSPVSDPSVQHHVRGVRGKGILIRRP